MFFFTVTIALPCKGVGLNVPDLFNELQTIKERQIATF